MNRLVQRGARGLLGMLLEGVPMQSIIRLTGVSIDTVAKLPNDAGRPVQRSTIPKVCGVSSGQDTARRNMAVRLRQGAPCSPRQGRAVRRRRCMDMAGHDGFRRSGVSDEIDFRRHMRRMRRHQCVELYLETPVCSEHR